jgi:large subunit ribosomal protein L4
MVDYLDKKLQSSKQSTIVLDDSSTENNTSFISQAIRTLSQRQRSVVAHTLVKGDVSGSNKKPWRQKGTGRARVGNKRNPVWRSGGIAFGPRNTKSFDLKLNSKQKNIGLAQALSQFQCYVVDGLESFSAKEFNLPVKSKFIAVADSNLLNIRNLPNLRKVCSSNQLSLIDLQSVGSVVIDNLAFEKLKKRLNLKEVSVQKKNTETKKSLEDKKNKEAETK